MNFINVDESNIHQEHIGCAISDKKGETCVSSKKAWLRERLSEGLVFRKLDDRGKVFIEYIPAQHAWLPIDALDYMHINCFWVSGKFKGQGISNQLLDYCIEDAKKKGMKGLTVLSSPKKMPFLSDPAYLKYKGFQVCDHKEPFFDLLYLPFEEDAYKPSFKSCVNTTSLNQNGFVLYYTNQCPHTDKYAPLLNQYADENNIPFERKKISSKEEAQNAPVPSTNYALYFNGKFITNEILSTGKFLKIYEGLKK